MSNVTNPRLLRRVRRKVRIKKKIDRQKGLIARLVVTRSNKFLYAQLVDDLRGNTLAQGNTREKGFEPLKSKKGCEAAARLGKLVGERALAVKVDRILFDRNGYDYHGRIKAIADGAREAGLKF
ncbi:MAG: 50S ribosomal protein L18 [Deltaproteobacteria bacterium]|nr:50S ribosomal protein L18 [Deltaproteobacteria bacterium]MBI3293538.1 50S ribosomal protein L18 [Deltaproteobacteria bacterium]